MFVGAFGRNKVFFIRLVFNKGRKIGKQHVDKEFLEYGYGSSPGFLEMDRLMLIAELIGPQFQEKVSTTLKNRLTAAHLKGFPEELADCVIRGDLLTKNERPLASENGCSKTEWRPLDTVNCS